MSVMTVGDIDRDIDTLRAHAQDWARLGIAGKIRHLRLLRARTLEAAAEWVALAAQAKGIAGTPLVGEEWLSGPYPFLTTIDRLGTTLGELARDGAPALPEAAIRTRADGQVVVDVFPLQRSEAFLMNGLHAEMWMEPEITRATVRERTGAAYKRTDPSGSVTLVLGAGNVSSIAPLDALTVLFARGGVTVVKLNPVSTYLAPILTRIFGALIDEGYVRIVEGGADLGTYLTTHPGIDAIHLTGSERTYRTIAAAAPRTPITCELGNVTPVIVVPGPWTAPDLAFQAAHVATQKLQNAGANCIAAQLLVTPSAWDHAPDVLARVRDALRNAPPRPAYYPGTRERVEGVLASHARAERLGDGGDGVPRVFVPDLDPNDPEEPLFREEVFGPVLAQTALPGEDAATFLRNAVAFCNAVPRGTLGVSILIHPRTIAALGPLFDDAVAALRYGSVAINAWPGIGFALAGGGWGAYPGGTGADPGSGTGIVHNALLFDHPQKTVLRAPFAPFPRSLGDGERTLLPTPPWFVTHRRADKVGRRLFDFTAHPSGLRMTATAIAAMRA
ncbi:MAG TPA: aldehyde dehydrogenase family protein [Candidatus Limnocylindria bacterium]|jgi:aldehyde dehydrogenase (NAD(P)+)|nr:aldehyde dehydrogenase family protein [Candidatus Limnocylindria bacterium]